MALELCRYPLATLLGALEELFPRGAPSRPRHGRHVLLEYVMLAGLNDSLQDAARLLALTARIECKFNLIVFNPHAGTRFRPSLPEQARLTPAWQCLSWQKPVFYWALAAGGARASRT